MESEQMDKTPLISVVIPAYNEADGIEKTIERVESILEKQFDSYEIIIVDDGSCDGTPEKIEKAIEKNFRIKLIRLTRNFGKESALSAGLYYSTGNMVVTMDSDLQHPPELIPQMYYLWKTKGVKVVNAVKKVRQQENFLKRIAVNCFYFMMKLLTGTDLTNQTDFKLLDRDVVEKYIALPENQKFFRGLVPWFGFSYADIYFSPEQRSSGSSGWSVVKLARMGIAAICSFSSVPMQAVTLLGGVMFAASIVMGAQTLFMKLTGHAVEGFATVILLLLFVGSVIMISLGIIGQYIAMIYHETKRRPGYVVEHRDITVISQIPNDESCDIPDGKDCEISNVGNRKEAG